MRPDSIDRKKLFDELSEKNIIEERMLTKEDAEHLSWFCWKMVDNSIEPENLNYSLSSEVLSFGAKEFCFQ